MKERSTLVAGALFGCLAVMLGAFGAHSLKPKLEAAGTLDAFEIAVRYQFYHALTLLFAGILMKLKPGSGIMRWASLSWTAGIVLFSGSLYYMALTSSTSLVLLTPLGGLMFIAGWVLLLLVLVKK